MNKVSIIIAAYNAEKYIEDTLSSVMCQTLKEIEAIVVNDGSTDRTEEIVKDYSKKCNKIKLITLSENKGLLTAHKEAFKVFDGEYVMFLDADDMLSPTACEIAYDAITKEKADIIQFDAEIFGDEDVLEKEKYSIQGLYSYIYPADKRIVFPGKAGLLGSSKQIGFTIWNKIYKKNVIDCVLAELPNTRLTMAEDSMLSFLICYYSRTYASISDKLYLYRFGSGISTAKKLNENQIECFAKLYFVYDFLKDFAEKKGILKECKKRLEELRIQMILGAAEKFLLHVQEDDAEKFLNVVSENKTPISSFFDALNFLVNFRNIAPQRKLVELCRHLPQFRIEKRKIKTIATYYFRVRNGGIENVIAQTTDAWIKDGYNVILITDEKPSDSDYALNPSIKRVVIPTRTHGDFESYEKRTKAIQNILKDNNVDLMVYHAWQYPQLLSDIISIKQLGIPVAVHTHGVFCTDFASESLDIAYRNLELHKVYEMCDAVITLNQADEAYWSSFGLKCIKTINPISFTKDTKPSDLRGKNILMTCRISPEKQIMDALSIIRKVRKKFLMQHLQLSAELIYLGTPRN